MIYNFKTERYAKHQPNSNMTPRSFCQTRQYRGNSGTFLDLENLQLNQRLSKHGNMIQQNEQVVDLHLPCKLTLLLCRPQSFQIQMEILKPLAIVQGKPNNIARFSISKKECYNITRQSAYIFTKSKNDSTFVLVQKAMCQCQVNLNFEY